MTEASPIYPGVTMSYESQISEFHRLIAAKQAEVNELGDRLQLLSVPPMETLLSSQLSPSERVEQVLRHQASEAERMKSIEAIRVVLDQAREELASLKASLSEIQARHEAAQSLDELENAIALYNAAAYQAHVRRERLFALTKKTYPVLKNAGYSPTVLFSVDPREAIHFAINRGSGIIQWSTYIELNQEQRLRLSVLGE